MGKPLRVHGICKVCGAEFWPEARQIRRGKGQCCSLSCSASLASANREQAGAANNNWKGGVSGRGPLGSKEVRTEAVRRYRRRYPEKHAAHLAMTNAIRRGELLRGVCEVCSSADVEGHHDDYGKPLAVRWLCKQHHLAHHRVMRCR